MQRQRVSRQLVREVECLGDGDGDQDRLRPVVAEHHHFDLVAIQPWRDEPRRHWVTASASR